MDSISLSPPAAFILSSLSFLLCQPLLKPILQYVVALNYPQSQSHFSSNYPQWEGADVLKRKDLFYLCKEQNEQK